jgi:hypothetical protein
MKRIISLSLVAVGILIFSSGCATDSPDVDEAGKTVMETNTVYSSVLPEINNMVKVFRNEPINVFVNTIENKTGNRGKLPADITAIVNTTFTKIGNYVVPIFNIEASENAKRQTFIINGAITEFDVIESKDSGINAAGTGTVGKNHNRYDTEGSIDSENQKVILGISLIPSDMHTGNYIPLKSTSNRVVIEKKSSANEFAFSILGSGFGFNNAITKSQGIHQSITALVELSVAEVLGKLGNFPYWLLLKGGKVDQNVLNNLVHQFLREPLNKKIEQVSYLLRLRGKDVEVTRVMTPKLKKAIIEFKKEHGLPADDTLSKDFYIALLTP